MDKNRLIGLHFTSMARCPRGHEKVPLQTTRSTHRPVFPLLAFLGGFTLLGCITDREARHQEAQALELEIRQGMSSGDWTTRTNAARACDRSRDVNCAESLATMARSEPNIDARTEAIRALAERCQEVERQSLAELASTWSPTESEATYIRGYITEAIGTCPSADAALVLSNFDPPDAPEVWAILQKLGITEPMPPAMEERSAWLARLAALPPPATRVNNLMESARAAQAHEAAERAAREAEAKRQEGAQARAFEQAGIEAAELAQRMLDADNLDEAWAAVTRAEGLGANVADLKNQVMAARIERGKLHLAAAWKFVRADKPDEADEKRRQATALGVRDDKIADAMAATPTARRRAREQEREARRQAEAEAREARRRAQEAEELKDPMTALARGYGCQERILQGSIVAQVERGLHEFAYIAERVSLTGEQLPSHGLVRTRKTAFTSPGEFQMCVLKKVVTKRIKTVRGFAETWEVYTEDVRSQPTYYFNADRQ